MWWNGGDVTAPTVKFKMSLGFYYTIAYLATL